MQMTEQQRADLERLIEHLQLMTDQYLRCPDVYMREWAKSLLALLNAIASALQGKEVEKR